MAPTYYILLVFVFVNCLLARSAYLLEERGFSPIFNYNYKKLLIKLFLLLSTAALICVAGLRDYVGTDFRAYIALFNIYARVSNKFILTHSEPIIPALGKICSRLFGRDNYQSMFFVLSLLTIGLYLLSTYRETKD